MVMGTYLSSGGVFNNYAIIQGVDHIMPQTSMFSDAHRNLDTLTSGALKLQEKIEQGIRAKYIQPIRNQGKKGI
jgi:NADH:ubiquinone oxidoreductase subunit B-like Fe-S oxidoreductase